MRPRPQCLMSTRDAGMRSVPSIVSSVSTRSHKSQMLVAESAAFGLAYTATLIWAGAALVASLSDGEANPYWPAVPRLRTDTAGVIAFGVAIVTLVISKYLRLKRRGSVPVQPAVRPASTLAVQAMAETAAVFGTGLVVYLSLNAVTHPYSLRLQLTHLWPWPSEGTVRVIGLGICLIAVATSRYLRTTTMNQISEATQVPEKGSVKADPALVSRATLGDDLEHFDASGKFGP
jgi:hypothetical protein